MRVRLGIKTHSLARGGLAAKLTPRFKQALDTARPRLAALVIAHASQAASRLLHTTYERYRNALRDPRALQLTDKGVEITIHDPVVAAIEGGAPGFDMKKHLLSKATKSSKDGTPYVDVPFQHAGRDIPQAMRRIVNSAARRTGASMMRVPLKTPGAQFERTVQKRRGSVQQQVAHKRGILDDLLRSAVKTGPRTKSVRYTTIRRISGKSAPSSWWHPGYRGLHVLRGVLPMIRPSVVAILRDSLRAAGLLVKR